MNPDSPVPTLLFVDDEPNILTALRRLFHRTTYRLLTAGSGPEGLALLEQEPVDLVVSDMQMPGMDGARFLEAVRSRWPGVVRILLTGHADLAATIAAINRGEIYRYIAKPWHDEDLLLTVRDALERQRLEAENIRLHELTQRQNEELRLLNAGLEQKVAERTVQLRAALGSLEQANRDLKKEFLTSVMVFSGLIELRGGHLGDRLTGHGRRVANLARTVAQRMGLAEGAVQDVMLAGLLHDIGKIGLSDELLDKPFQTLSAEARAKVMRHPAVGQNVLMAVAELKEAAGIIRHHHEYWDGSGYPDGLASEAIEPGARILVAVNDYDALQIGTLTHRAMKADEALAYLVANRGKRYDPAVVDAFAAWVVEQQASVIADIPLHPAELRPAMMLARDLTHRDGYLLLAAGHLLDAHLIDRLAVLEENDGHPLTLHIRIDSVPPATAG